MLMPSNWAWYHSPLNSDVPNLTENLLDYKWFNCTWPVSEYMDGLVQDFSNSIANALELLQSCTKPSICIHEQGHHIEIMTFLPIPN